MANIFKDPVVVTFVDGQNRQLHQIFDPGVLPRVGDNVLLMKVPFIAERVGFDISDKGVDRVVIQLRPA